jgi:hypothetical protein
MALILYIVDINIHYKLYQSQRIYIIGKCSQNNNQLIAAVFFYNSSDD